MSSSTEQNTIGKTISPSDLARQFHRVRELSLNKLRITIDVSSPLVNSPVIFLQAFSFEEPAPGAAPIEHVWAQRIVSVPNGTISLWAVFDLLISAERVLDEELSRMIAQIPPRP